MATPYTTQAPAPRPARPAAPAGAPSAELISTYLELFTATSTDHALMQPHGINRDGDPYSKYVRRPGAITAAMVVKHLSGVATLATQPQRAGRANVLVFDLDAGQDLQEAVERVASLGLWAFGAASWSAAADGSPAHQGGHVWIILDQPGPADRLGAAAAAIAARLGWGAVECWPRPGVDVRLPFGRNLRAQAGREWGALYRPGLAPLELTSGAQGLTALLSSIQYNPLAAILAYAPITECPQIAQNGPGRTKQAPADNLDGPRLIQAFNARINMSTVLEHFKAQPAGSRRARYRCGCGGHTTGQENALKIVTLKRGGQGVQAYGANCVLYGKTHDAFGALQTLGGFSMAGALDEARQWLNMPAFEPARPAARPLQKRHTPAAPPVIDQPAEVLRAAQHRAGLDGELTKAARRVLAFLLDQAAGRGWCQIENRAIQLAADCCRATARTALYTLRDRGYITIDTSGNAWGGSEANIYTFVQTLAPLPIEKSAAVRDIQGGGLISVTPYNVLNTQYGGGNSAPAAEIDPAALLTCTGPADDNEWESLFAGAPLADDVEHEPAIDDYPPPYCDPQDLSGPAAQVAPPSPVESITPTTTRANGAQQPASTDMPDYVPGEPLRKPVNPRKIEPMLESMRHEMAVRMGLIAPARYAGRPGPNSAALAILLQDPTYDPNEVDQAQPLDKTRQNVTKRDMPAAPAGPVGDPPRELINQATDLVDAGDLAEYDALIAQHPGYRFPQEDRPCVKRWRGVLPSQRPQAAERTGPLWSMAA